MRTVGMGAKPKTEKRDAELAKANKELRKENAELAKANEELQTENDTLRATLSGMKAPGEKAGK